MKYWITKEGKKIPYKKIEDMHLMNILNYIKRLAEYGLDVEYGYMGWDTEDMFYGVETEYGDDVLERLDYYSLLEEAKRRGIVYKEEVDSK